MSRDRQKSKSTAAGRDRTPRTNQQFNEILYMKDAHSHFKTNSIQYLEEK
jgi:hypothetical protein